jgi:hypothetical protein
MPMDDNTLEQRIKYLIEHGGVWDDPIADVRRLARWGVALGTVALVIELVAVILLH